MNFHPLNQQIVEIVPSGVGGAVKNGINISLKNAHRAFIYCVNRKGADATQCTWTLAQSSGNAGSAAGTGEKAMTNNVPIYFTDDWDTNPVLAETTAAKAYQQAITQSRTQCVVFEIVPEACMDISNASTPFDCVTVNSSDPGAANSVYAFAVIEGRNAPLPTPFSD
jgi:hypothetical protein